MKHQRQRSVGKALRAINQYQFVVDSVLFAGCRMRIAIQFQIKEEIPKKPFRFFVWRVTWHCDLIKVGRRGPCMNLNGLITALHMCRIRFRRELGVWGTRSARGWRFTRTGGIPCVRTHEAIIRFYVLRRVSSRSALRYKCGQGSQSIHICSCDNRMLTALVSSGTVNLNLLFIFVVAAGMFNVGVKNT